jgi:hypothetical protein
MRDYAKVSPSFWARGSGKRLRGDADAQVLALYLVTCPAANMIGVYYVPFVAVAHETGLGLERATEAMRRIEVAKYAFYDHESELVWVPNMAAYQIGDTMKTGDKLGDHPFVWRFVERYGLAYSLGGDWVQPVMVDAPTLEAPEEAPPKGLARGFEGASKGHPDQESTPGWSSAILGKSRRRAGEEQEQERVQGEDPAPAPPRESEREPEPERTTATTTKTKGARLDPEWRPSPTTIKRFAEREGVDAMASFERFQNHWLSTSRNAAKSDWDRTFVNWVLDDIARGRATAYVPPPTPIKLPTEPIATFIDPKQIDDLFANMGRRA